jgi:hypothetical protein
MKNIKEGDIINYIGDSASFLTKYKPYMVIRVYTDYILIIDDDGDECSLVDKEVEKVNKAVNILEIL